MQWRDATVGGTDATGFKASGSVAARQEPDVRQVFDQVGLVGQAQVRQVDGVASEVAMASQFAVAGSATPLPVGLDLPCTQDPELFLRRVSRRTWRRPRTMCRGCKARLACLTGALERRGALVVSGAVSWLMRGAIVPRKRPRGRPRKTEVAA